MRKTGIIGGMNAIGALAMASIGSISSIAAVQPIHHMGRPTDPKGKRPLRSKFLPHQGRQEIERRLRNAQRDKTNQTARLIRAAK